MEDQTMLSHYSMIALCLSSTASILPLHSLNLCIPSVSPTPLSFFFFTFSVSRDVYIPSLNSPATLITEATATTSVAAQTSTNKTASNAGRAV